MALRWLNQSTSIDLSESYRLAAVGAGLRFAFRVAPMAFTCVFTASCPLDIRRNLMKSSWVESTGNPYLGFLKWPRGPGYDIHCTFPASNSNIHISVYREINGKWEKVVREMGVELDNNSQSAKMRDAGDASDLIEVWGLKADGLAQFLKEIFVQNTVIEPLRNVAKARASRSGPPPPTPARRPSKLSPTASTFTPSA